MPYAIDLFCGAGGMSEGLIQAGFQILFSSDINADVEKTYVARHEQLGLYQGVNTYFKRADIRDLASSDILKAIENLEMFKNKAVPSIDAIFGGPPCQGFSRAGLRDKDDPRNTLFKEYLRIIKDIKPSYVVMENVEGFLDTRLDGYVGVTGKRYKDNLLMPELLQREFELIGYKTLDIRVLDASDFGVPQRRRRVIFLAYLDGKTPPLYPTPTTPNVEDKVSVLDAVGDLIVDPEVRSKLIFNGSDYQQESIRGRTKDIHGNPIFNDGLIANHDLSSHSELVKERFSLFRQDETSAMLIGRIRDEGIDMSYYPNLLKLCQEKLGNEYTREQIMELFSSGEVSDRMIQVLLTKKSNRYRLDQNKVSPTMVTMPDDYLTPFENRIPTVREMARIQSFDDSFEFLGKRTTGGKRRRVEVPQYTQVGNAVPPLLSRAIALEIKKAIKSSVEYLQVVK